MFKKVDKSILFIFLTVLVDVIGLAVIIPVMPKLIEEIMGADVSEASKYGSWLMFSYAIMQFIFSPIMGSLSDRYGRRPILLLSLLGMCLNYALMIYAPTFGWLFLGRLLSGISGASITTANAYIADVSAPEKRTQNFGLIGVAFGLGFIVGPLIGGLVADISPRAPFAVSALITLLNLAYGYFVLPESLPEDRRRPFEWKRANPINSILNLRKHPVISQLAVSLFLIYMAGHAMQSTWSYYNIYKFNWSEKEVGISLAVFGVVLMIVQGLVIRWTVKNWGAIKSILIGNMAYAIGMIMYAFATEGWMMYVITIPYCLGGIAGPSLQGIMSSLTTPDRQGELQGALTGVMSITSIFGPLLMLNVFHQFSGKDAITEFPGMPYLIGSIFMILATIFALPFLRNNSIKPKP
jgi:DHA1 family tetracycline resistance protein-like MFS transporter